MLLVKKYVPEKIVDVLGNREVVEILRSIGENFPHLLFTGPPGTGKTTSAHLLSVGHDVLELNASDERGIETIRTKVKNFCYKNTKNKLVILDECDHLTEGAQQSLRRLMEETETIFILICNHVSKIIEPIQSRCAILQFNRINDEVIKKKLSEICLKEDIWMTDDAINSVVEVCDGDMRRCINSLESVRGLRERVDADFIFRINGVASYAKVEEIIDSFRKGMAHQGITTFENIWDEKYEPNDLMDSFFRVAKKAENYELLKIIGKYHTRVIEGTSSKIQFYSMFSDLFELFTNV